MLTVDVTVLLCGTVHNLNARFNVAEMKGISIYILTKSLNAETSGVLTQSCWILCFGTANVGRLRLLTWGRLLCASCWHSRVAILK